jgi:hypothetical protein
MEKGQPYRDTNNPDQDKRSRALLGHQLIMGLQPTPEGLFEGEVSSSYMLPSFNPCSQRRPNSHMQTGSATHVQAQANSPKNCFNQLKREENALVLSRGSFVGPKIDWADSNHKAK